MYPISFKSTNDEYNSNNIKKRFTRLLGGTIVGGAAALPYYKYQKNYTGKKLFFNSLETGAAVGLFVDVVSLIFEMPNAMKKGLNVQNGIKQSDSINLEPYKNKDFFINLYSNKNQNSQELNEYQEKLNDKDFCNSLFQNKDILKASQEALLEVNNAKIAEALKNNDTETIKQLELMNALLLAGIKSDTQTNMSDNHTQNPSFKSIFNLFHENNETLKQKAEVIVNRHASSAATASCRQKNSGPTAFCRELQTDGALRRRTTGTGRAINGIQL